MNLVCGCCEMPFTRAGDLPLLRGTPRHGDLICVGCGWLVQRELRHLPLPSKEWCPAHGDWKDSGAMGGMHAAPWQLVGSKL